MHRLRAILQDNVYQDVVSCNQQMQWHYHDYQVLCVQTMGSRWDFRDTTYKKERERETLKTENRTGRIALSAETGIDKIWKRKKKSYVPYTRYVQWKCYIQRFEGTH